MKSEEESSGTKRCDSSKRIGVFWRGIIGCETHEKHLEGENQ